MKLKNVSDHSFKTLFNVVTLVNIHNVSCITRGLEKFGGLTLMWSKDVNLYILNSNKKLIDFYVRPNHNSNFNYMMQGTMAIIKVIKEF